MTLQSWSEQYLIGDSVIDAEHKELFKLINDFHSHWLEARDRKDIAQLLNQLVLYAQMHFQHEEAIMKEAGFPQLDEHHKIHELLFDTIFKLHHAYAENDFHLEGETMKFMKFWLLEHIMESDYPFRDFLARKKKDEAQAAS